MLSWLGRGVGVAAGVGITASVDSAMATTGAGARVDPELDRGGQVTVLANGTVLDGTGAAPWPDTTVVLAGDRIVAVGRYPLRDLPDGVTVVDVHGKYVLPGLWDTHTHGGWLLDTFAPLHLANGVTGVREMVGPPGMEEVRELLNSGQVPGPRMVLASELVDGPHSAWGGGDTGAGVIEAGTPTEGRAAVQRAHEMGADFVKVYSYLAPDVYDAIATEAARLDIWFAGHIPAQVTAQDAIRSGQHTLEHQYGIYLSTATDREDRYRRLREVFADPDRAGEWAETMGQLEMDSVRRHDRRQAEELFALMRRHGTWYSPTLGVERTARLPGEDLLADSRLLDLLERYIQPTMREQWLANARARLNRPPEQNARMREYVAAQARLTGAAAGSGVPIIAGTDCWIPFVFPGFSMHDELALLVQAGLTPMRALQAATRDAARCVGWGEQSGTVTPGKLADLLILRQNPLEDIRHTTTIDAVVSRGRYISSREREAMLAEAETAAQQD
ncbi:imidazolonepropionase-like amidohydrolase [Tamaricihabitans halophyticus]|uniref:Imidazolonepropionase-like amidohydrolase n=1 Tax=Tamaricihabitans halophyticus TaxID=1262583 RepID=A0A4R2QBU0_9PSEU|nr:imidazolonepropionase-like amidohydrolase [Tamaricihabitans halophyticus]